MSKKTEPLDSLTGRIATGIHQVATAVLVAKDATRAELDLAALILIRDPELAAPLENASTVETFNRLLDVAINSANQSAGCGSRAQRRAKLCAALERERVVIIDSATLAELVNAKLELEALRDGMVVSAPGPVPLLEALEAAGDELEQEDLEALARSRSTSFSAPTYFLESNPGTDVPRDYAPKFAVSAEAEEALDAMLADACAHGLGVTRVGGTGEVTHVPIGEFLEGGERGDLADHRLND